VSDVPAPKPGIGAYAKFYVALMAALYMLADALADGHVTGRDWVRIAIAAGTAINVFIVPNSSASGPSGSGATRLRPGLTEPR
jgi:hypothetical protein